MVKLTLTFVKRTERTSAKSGKPYTSLSIKAKEYNENFLSGFGNKENASWKEGDVVEVAEVKEVSKDGKIYYNFEMPKFMGGNVALQQTLERIENALTRNHLATINGLKELAELITTGKKADTYPDKEKEIGLKEGETHPFDDDAGLEHLNEDNLGF